MSKMSKLRKFLKIREKTYDPFTLIDFDNNGDFKIADKFDDEEKSSFTKMINFMKQILFIYPFQLVIPDYIPDSSFLIAQTCKRSVPTNTTAEEDDLLMFDKILTERKGGLKRRHVSILVSFYKLTIPRRWLISLLEF
jgi:hypothetical protein